MWITETSSAYGGGTASITDRFAASFWFVVCACMGRRVCVCVCGCVRVWVGVCSVYNISEFRDLINVFEVLTYSHMYLHICIHI